MHVKCVLLLQTNFDNTSLLSIMATKSVRLLAPKVSHGHGTIAVPYLFDGQTLNAIAKKVDNGSWVLVDKSISRPDGRVSFGRMCTLISGLAEVGILYDVQWLNCRCCIFRDHSLSFCPVLEVACNTQGWGYYMPKTTWRPIA